MQESLEERYDRMVAENPRQVLAVHFRIERRKFKRFRLIVDASKWNTVNPQSYSGTDVRCFLDTLGAARSRALSVLIRSSTAKKMNDAF